MRNGEENRWDHVNVNDVTGQQGKCVVRRLREILLFLIQRLHEPVNGACGACDEKDQGPVRNAHAQQPARAGSECAVLIEPQDQQHDSDHENDDVNDAVCHGNPSLFLHCFARRSFVSVYRKTRRESMEIGTGEARLKHDPLSAFSSVSAAVDAVRIKKPAKSSSPALSTR